MAESVQKKWGVSIQIERSYLIQIERIVIRKGGYCSLHRHVGKDNIFIVLAGSLQVNLHTGSENQFCTPKFLHKDDAPLLVPAGQLHRFIALDDVEALEVYRSANGSAVDPNDIERIDEGGMRKA